MMNTFQIEVERETTEANGLDKKRMLSIKGRQITLVVVCERIKGEETIRVYRPKGPRTYSRFDLIDTIKGAYGLSTKTKTEPNDTPTA